MDNQHRKIVGYKELSQEDINAINEVKQSGIDLRVLLDKLTTNPHIILDAHWYEIGVTHLQQGLMALTRSIVKPNFL